MAIRSPDQALRTPHLSCPSQAAPGSAEFGSASRMGGGKSRTSTGTLAAIPRQIRERGGHQTRGARIGRTLPAAAICGDVPGVGWLSPWEPNLCTPRRRP
jgi:hypothetical protein